MGHDDACGLLYLRNGDPVVCWLPLNHDGACPEANAFRAGLETRTQAAQSYLGPWL